jgi:hypothetical protein
VSPRHGDGGRTNGAGCRDTGGIGLGGSVTIVSHGGHGQSGTGCWTRGGSPIWAGFGRARSAPATRGMGTSWACSERAATRLRRAGARFVGEAGRGCYCARCPRGWTCCERPEEKRRGRHYAQVAGAGARTRQGPGTLRRWGAATASARLCARGLHAGAMDLLRAAGHDGRARPRRGTKKSATRGCQDTANAHGGRENGEGERGRGEFTSADERRRSGGDPRRGRDEGRRWWARNCAKIPDGSVLETSWARKLRRAVLGKIYSAPYARAYEQRRRRSTRAELGALGALGVRLGRDCAGAGPPRRRRASWARCRRARAGPARGPH